MKNAKVIVFSFCIALIFMFGLEGKHQVKAAENDTDSIKQVIEEYFNWYFVSVNNLSEEDVLKLDSIIKNDILKSFIVADAKVSNKWYKSLNNELKIVTT